MKKKNLTHSSFTPLIFQIISGNTYRGDPLDKEYLQHIFFFDKSSFANNFFVCIFQASKRLSVP